MQTRSEIQAQIERLQKKLDSLPEDGRALCGETYYCIDERLVVREYVESNYKTDQRRYDLGNYFLTEEEAQQEADLRLFEQRVTGRFRQLNGGGYKFRPGEENYSIIIDTDANRVLANGFYYGHGLPRGWWSSNKEVVEIILEEFGEKAFLSWAKGGLGKSLTKGPCLDSLVGRAGVIELGDLKEGQAFTWGSGEKVCVKSSGDRYIHPEGRLLLNEDSVKSFITNTGGEDQVLRLVKEDHYAVKT